MNSILQQFLQRKSSSALIQFIKYCIAGGVATVVHITTFYLLSWLIIPALTPDDLVARFAHISIGPISDAIRARNAMINNWLAFIVSNMVAYLLNILWVFESGRHNKLVEIGLFYMVSAISIAVGSSVMWVLIRYFGFSTTVAFSAEVVAAVAINFVVRKLLIFKR